jgi:hypothetical protein
MLIISAKFSKSLMIELLSAHREKRLDILISYPYTKNSTLRDNNNKSPIVLLTKSLSTLILTALGISPKDSTVSLLSTALCASYSRYTYNLILLVLLEKNNMDILSLVNNESIRSATVENSKKEEDPLKNSIDISGNSTEQGLYDMLSTCTAAVSSFDHPLFKDYQLFLSTFMTKPVSTENLNEVKSLHSKLWATSPSLQSRQSTTETNTCARSIKTAYNASFEDVIKFKSEFFESRQASKNYFSSITMNNVSAILL